MRKLLFCALIVIGVLLGTPQVAQSTPSPIVSETPELAEAPSPSSNAPPLFDNAKRAGAVSLMSNREFWLSVIILTFGLFIVTIEFFLLRDIVKDKTEEIARIYTVTLIIIGTLVLISSGFTNEQIAPALGLFGTIAGYLLGRSDFKVAQRESHDGD